MKIYSAETISRSEVTDKLSLVDEKQTRQIRLLRYWLAASFVANVALTVALRYL